MIKAGWINEDEVELSFKDTGCGITQENLRKVFWPLFSSKARGMGFGLTLSQMIVEKHGGKITAESEPGEGTTFVMNLAPFGRTFDTDYYRYF